MWQHFITCLQCISLYKRYISSVSSISLHADKVCLHIQGINCHFKSCWHCIFSYTRKTSSGDNISLHADNVYLHIQGIHRQVTKFPYVYIFIQSIHRQDAAILYMLTIHIFCIQAYVKRTQHFFTGWQYTYIVFYSRYTSSGRSISLHAYNLYLCIRKASSDKLKNSFVDFKLYYFSLKEEHVLK